MHNAITNIRNRNTLAVLGQFLSHLYAPEEGVSHGHNVSAGHVVFLVSLGLSWLVVAPRKRDLRRRELQIIRWLGLAGLRRHHESHDNTHTPGTQADVCERAHHLGAANEIARP